MLVDLAVVGYSTLALLPVRSPWLVPVEDLGRGLTATMAANRFYANLDERVHHALVWLPTMTPADRLCRYDSESSRFDLLALSLTLRSQ